MNYLYGELNNLIEAQKYTFKSTDGILQISNNDKNVDFTVNTSSLVTLKRIQKDFSVDDDKIQYYGLFAYNSNTKTFDIQLGDEIKIDTSISGTGFSDKLLVKTGEKQITDENGFIIGTEPVFSEITISKITGQLVLEQIPVTALVDHEKVLDIAGNEVGRKYFQSVLDGNYGGEVY